MTINSLIAEISPYYNDNLNHYNEYSYLLTFVDKVPIEKYKHCDPFVNDTTETKQYIEMDKQIYSVKPSTGNKADSLLTSLFQEFNTKFQMMDFFLRFSEFKTAFFNDLKYNLKKQDKKLIPLCEKGYINEDILHFIAKRYSICMIIIQDITYTYGDPTKKTIRMKLINNKYHRLTGN
jgi:hypothetical protein